MLCSDMGNVTFADMLRHGWPILSILLLMSIFSIALIYDRYETLRRSRPRSKNLENKILDALEKGDAASALACCQSNSPGPEQVYARLLTSRGDRESLEKELWCAIQETIQHLEGNVAYLGTVASTAPFVGLLGTVIGVIRAFMDIASIGGGGFEVVSAGIAEALVATATGLFVAIPAVVAFNYFNGQIQKLATEMEVAGHRMINRMHGLSRKAPPPSSGGRP